MTATVAADADALTITLTADVPVGRQRLWDAFADIRQFERFWGAPGRPTTFTRHDVAEGGQTAYWETTTGGEIVRTRWEWGKIEPLTSFVLLDEDADEFGEPSRDLPATRITANLTEADGGTRLTLVLHFGSHPAYQAALTAATERVGHIAAQLAEVLADPDSHLTPPTVRVISETMIRLSGYLRVSVEEAWRAHVDKELLYSWFAPEDDWDHIGHGGMDSGEDIHFEWAHPETGGRIGSGGEVLESIPPRRIVLTLRPIGVPVEEFVNAADFIAVDGGTVFTMVMHFQSREDRDALHAGGLPQAFEQAYARLEHAVRTQAVRTQEES